MAEAREKCEPLQTKAPDDGDDGDGVAPLKIRVYKRRWLVLGIFAFYSGVSTCQWIQYSIITNIVCRYYGVSALTVDWTAMSFMAYYVVLVFPTMFLVDKWGLRWSALFGSGLTCLGTWVKVFSVQPDRFYVTFIGHSLVAIAQVFVLILPGRLAAQWFDSRQISTATSLGIFGSQLGVALSFLLTPVVVRNHENVDAIGDDLSFLFWSVSIIASVAFVTVLFLFDNEPKLPPSETRALQKLGQSEEAKKEQSFTEILKRLSRNKCYLLLCNTYGLNVGVLNAIGTLLNQIYLLHFENGERDAGRIGLAMIVTGMLGSVSFGVILDKTHKFKETTVAVYFLSFCGQVLFAVFTYYELKWLVYLSATFLGYFMSGYLALGYEMCAEYTYPEPEDVAAGILNVANNLYGVILVIIMGRLLESHGDVPVHLVLCGALLLGFVMTALTRDEQRRQDARRAAIYEGLVASDSGEAVERVAGNAAV